MKSLLKHAASLAKSLDRGQQNEVLSACGIDPRRARSKMAKLKARSRRAYQGVKNLSQAFGKEDFAIGVFVFISTEDDDEVMCEVIDHETNDDGEFICVVQDLGVEVPEDEEDPAGQYDCRIGEMTLIPEDEMEAAMAEAGVGFDDENEADGGDGEEVILEAEFVEE